MPLDTRSNYAGPARGPAGQLEIIGLKNGNWGERVVTVVAASVAVLIVAVIAVLMGMA